MALFNAETQRQLFEANPRWRIMAILRAIVVLFSLIGFSVFAGAIPIWDEYFYWDDGPNKGDWEDGFPLGILVFAFIWNIIALFLLLVRRRPVKPWRPLILDFLTWATLVPAVTWSAGLGMYLNWDDTIEEYVDPGLWALIHRIGRLELAALVFTCFVWLLEVTLFVFDCIDTHKWRKAKKALPPSVRQLDHSELAQEQQEYAQPPKYESQHGGDIEMSPTSPTTREFV